jgi:hypothetical protein
VSTFVLTDAIFGFIIARDEPTMILAVEQNVTVRISRFRAWQLIREEEDVLFENHFRDRETT